MQLFNLFSIGRFLFTQRKYLFDLLAAALASFAIALKGLSDNELC